MFGSTSVSSAASQYLHPDYLSPLPTTLDAKKSPLALLAQTCNSIGKDISPGRSILKTTSSSSSSSSSTREAKDKDTRTTRDSPWKISRDHGAKVKDDSETNERSKVNSPVEDSKSDETTESGTTIQASSSSSSSSGSTSRCCSDGRRSGTTPAGNGKSFTPVSASSSVSTASNTSCPDQSRNNSSSNRKFPSKEKTGPRSQSARSVAATSASSPKKDSGGGAGGEPEEGWLVDRSVTNSPKTDRFSGNGDLRSSSGSTYKTHDQKPTRSHPAVSPGTTTTEPPFAHFRHTTSSSSPATTIGGGADCLSPLVLSYLTGMPQYAGSLLPPGSMDPLATKFPSATSLSAYLAYLQSRGGGGLGPPCKDPFCTECPVAATHPLPLPFPSMTLFDKTLTGPSLRPPYALPLHDRPCLPTGPVSLEALSALYAAGSLAGSALSPPTALPGAWVCPWVTTDGEYCGKRCSSAEDLLVHTRNHWPSSRLSPSPSLHSVAAGLSAGWTGYHPYYPFGPSVSSMALLRHAYGGGGAARNLSPAATGLFSLGGGGVGAASASSRYHPYKSPSTSVSLSSPSSSFDLYNSQRTMGAAAP